MPSKFLGLDGNLSVERLLTQFELLTGSLLGDTSSGDKTVQPHS